MEIVMPGLSTRIKELRAERKLTQKEMSVLMQCTLVHYQRIEYGQINLPSLDLMLLAVFFHVSTDYLLGRSDERNF